MASSGSSGWTGSRAENWRIKVEWRRTDANGDTQRCTVQARVCLMYWTSSMREKATTITLSAAGYWRQIGTSIPAHSDYSHPNQQLESQHSGWVTFYDIPIDDNGNCAINVSAWQEINAMRLADGTRVTSLSVGTGDVWLDNVEVHSKINKTTNSGGGWSKSAQVWKTTNKGSNWGKVDMYKTTNWGNSWSKIK